MGRVYNALMKADKWKDGRRPIGRPVQRPKEQKIGGAEEQGGRGVIEVMRPELDHPQAPIPLRPLAESNLAPLNPIGENPLLQEAPLLPLSPLPAPVFVEPIQSVKLSELDAEPHLAALTGGDMLAVERYRTLAVRLMNMAARRKLKTLLVTSAREGEGKTTVAINLAWIMSKPAERRVLLIDADLRRPEGITASSVARKLGVTPERGWLDLLEGRAEFKDAALRIDPNGLYLLTSATAPEAADALTSKRIEDLLEYLEQRFDFVVIDAPPILELADAQRLACVTDGTLFVTSAGRTHHHEVTEAVKLVPQERRLGVVLNGAEIDQEISRAASLQIKKQKAKGKNRSVPFPF